MEAFMQVIGSTNSKHKNKNDKMRKDFRDPAKKIELKMKLLREKAALLQIPFIHFLTWIPNENKSGFVIN